MKTSPARRERTNPNQRIPLLNILILILSGCLLITSIFVLLLAAHVPSLEPNGNATSRNAGHGNLRSLAVVSSDVQQHADTSKIVIALAAAPQQIYNDVNHERKTNGYIHRFPQYGTPEFRELCKWTMADADTTTSTAPLCYMLSRPRPTTSEGISEWVTDVAVGKIYAIQLGCRHILDYGPGVDVHSVLTYAEDGEYVYNSNWTVPDGILNGGCKSHNSEMNCHKAAASWTQKTIPSVRKDVAKVKAKSGIHMAPKTIAIPNYRWAYAGGKILPLLPAVVEASSNGNSNLQGFEFETGMGCSLGSTFKLAPAATQYLPGLHSDILPALRDDGALAIALYMRTGRTDRLLRGGDPAEDTTKLAGMSQQIISCALELERDHLAKGTFTHSVWFVATDAPNVGRTVVTLYNGGNVTVSTTHSSEHIFRRRVYNTAARGVQTKAQSGPKTADFAEAMIDWYLLGESDFVISMGGYTFANTAALRTARPIYKAFRGGCQALVLPTLDNNSGSNKFPPYHW